MEGIMDVLQYAILALGCFIVALLLKDNRARILQFTADLINRAEVAVQGSGMGAEKKSMVLAQLDAAGIKVTAWLDKQIDVIVATLNANGAWLATQAKQHAAGTGSTLDETTFVTTPHILHTPQKVNADE